MAFLESFSAEEKTLLVSLPYRVGIWVSNADKTGNALSSIHERDELHKIIAKKAAGLFESAFVHEIMSELKLREADWPKWQGQIGDIEADCRTAVTVVSAKLIEHDAKGYKENIMQIATTVALSFREFDVQTSFCKKITTHLGIAFDKFMGGFKGESYVSSSLLNISVAEDMALSKLAKALQFESNIVLPDK